MACLNEAARRRNSMSGEGDPTGSETVTTAVSARKILKALAWFVLLCLAAGFVVKYVLHYYFQFNESSFGPFWRRRTWLLIHITGGTLALFSGPFQFSTRLRRNHSTVYRWLGRLFLLGVTVGSAGANVLAFSSSFGWAPGVALFSLSVVWSTCASMAFYSLVRGMNRYFMEWMTRAYVSTLAFLAVPLLNDYGPTSRLLPVSDRRLTLDWAAWVIPIVLCEFVLQLLRMKKEEREGARQQRLLP